MTAQAWLLRRFNGLSPSSFQDGVFIYSIEDLQPPPLFSGVFRHYDVRTSAVQPETLQHSNAVLILSNPCDQLQMRALATLISDLNEYCDIPPVFWMPHTVAPEVRPHEALTRLCEGNLCHETMERGLDDILGGEPEGAGLVVAVLTRIQRSAALSTVLNNVLGERRRGLQAKAMLENAVHDVLWCQLLVRTAPAVPPVDFNLPSGDLRAVPGYNVGKELGTGSFCKVYRLLPLVRSSTSTEEVEVIKIVDKARIKEPEGIKQLGRMISVMALLDGGWRHPNITTLTAIYHSPTHFCFCETYGGPENLFHWLSRFQGPDPGAHPVSAQKTVPLMQQLCGAVAFIHTGPSVCHLDIKPENVIVNDTPAAITLKLTDFDLAAVQKPGVLRQKPCGTLPFIAPEVLAGQGYDGMAADVWSVGMVLFEVQCGIRLMDRILDLGHTQIQGASHRDSETTRKIVGMIKSCFAEPGTAGKSMQQYSCEELQHLAPMLAPVFDGIFRIPPEERFKAECISDALADFERQITQ